MTVDAHQHFISYTASDYPWIDEQSKPLMRDFLPNELEAACRGVGVDGTVAVQARQTIEETEWLLELARGNPTILGVVGWVDMRDPGLASILERYAGEPHLKGVRHVLHDEADDDFMLREDFCRGVGMLKRFGLTYDLLIFARHLPQTLELVRRYPGQAFVIDHIAKPSIGEGKLEEWLQLLRPVSECPNVFCKLSGMVTEARSGLWRSGILNPYIENVLELFGPDRTMFGSDWPVCTIEAGYGEVLGIVQEATATWSPVERSMIFGGTASRFYGLEGS
ncbi:MAG TPA: amidohydrolase family protein [Spirochaetia bacterium]|nr:amidohydrolase family protein [Spirochaetia bacterium]